jgi:hypothetical protein
VAFVGLYEMTLSALVRTRLLAIRKPYTTTNMICGFQKNPVLAISGGIHPFILGVVGWVPLAELGASRILDRLVLHSRLKAVRHVLHDEPDDFYMLNNDFNRGVDLLESYGVAYDILIFERHLPQTISFVDRHPGQVFVIVLSSGNDYRPFAA